jgi:hypothetical protein
MGARIRTRLSGLGRSEDASAGLTESDLQSALGRLHAYDADPRRRDRRKRVETDPPLHRRAGLWRR